MNPFNSLPRRFWDKVEAPDPEGCWLWTASKTGGYGVFSVKGQILRAHRVAYEALVGPIPDGLQLDHLCRNRACVRPEHLEPVSQKVNILRGESFSAERAKQTHCKVGHPFDAENTALIRQGDYLLRRCRECDRERQRRYRVEKNARRGAA